jgi:hypothetical protein
MREGLTAEDAGSTVGWFGVYRFMKSKFKSKKAKKGRAWLNQP